MAVFTEVSPLEASGLMSVLGLGSVQSLQGCASGIENTNYFVSTDQGDYVLTLFERLKFEQLPFYLELMRHLAERGIPVPAPQPDAQGRILHTLNGKPAAVVTRLKGRNQLNPQATDCAQVGAMLARMHLAGLDYPAQQPNLRGLTWWTETIPVVAPYLNDAQRDLIQSELT
ncbi:MAG: phosphotransferase, partial [Pseudomonadota bacterium]